MYSSLRLRHREPKCEIGPEERMVILNHEFENLTTIGWDISSFNCYKLLNAVGYVSFRREWSYSMTCSSRLDAHPHRNTCSCC